MTWQALGMQKQEKPPARVESARISAIIPKVACHHISGKYCIASIHTFSITLVINPLKHRIIKICLLILPMCLTPVWGYFLATGTINLGGGDKDILVLIPYLLWSILYLASGLFFLKCSIRRMAGEALLYSLGIMLALWVAVFIYDQIQ